MEDIGKALEKDGLPRSAGSQHGEDTSPGHRKIDAVENDAAAEALPQPLHLKHASRISDTHDQMKKELTT